MKPCIWASHGCNILKAYNMNLQYDATTVPAWLVRQKKKSFCEVPKCDKYKTSLAQNGWIAEIDEIHVYKNHNILELKALRGGMNVTETTHYNCDAEFFMYTIHGCRMMIKILL